MIPKALTTKGASRPGRSNPLSGFSDFLLSQGFGSLNAALAVRYYSIASPLASAIDKIAEPFSEIEPIVQNDKTKEVFPDHPVLKLLKNPNPMDSTENFQMKLAAWFVINGEVFLTATGPVNREPLELFVDSAVSASLSPAKDGFLGQIQFGLSTDSQIYTRSEMDLGGSFRYYNRGDDAEAWQIARFNARQTNGVFRGGSKLQAIMPEIEQYIEASTHNLSILLRGARPSGVFTSPEPLTDEQREALKEGIDNWFSGSANAGRPILLDGGGVDGKGGMKYTDVMMTNRDMDFLKLKENVTEMIFTRLDIPLALVSTKSMTLDNLKVAKLGLYDDAVIPLTNRLYGELTQMLMPRYKNSEGLIITFNPTTIPALETRRTENIKLRKEIGANTINEMRKLLGDDELAEGGDEVLQPINLIPIGADPFNQRDSSEKQVSEYERLLKQQVDSEGKQKFTDKEIQFYVDSYLQGKSLDTDKG